MLTNNSRLFSWLTQERLKEQIRECGVVNEIAKSVGPQAAAAIETVRAEHAALESADIEHAWTQEAAHCVMRTRSDEFENDLDNKELPEAKSNPLTSAAFS